MDASVRLRDARFSLSASLLSSTEAPSLLPPVIVTHAFGCARGWGSPLPLSLPNKSGDSLGSPSPQAPFLGWRRLRVASQRAQDGCLRWH